VKYKSGTEFKREIVSYREDSNSPWIPWKKSESQPIPTDVKNTPSTSAIDE
jgi:hypothetical protein